MTTPKTATCPTCGTDYHAGIRVGDEDKFCSDGWHDATPGPWSVSEVRTVEGEYMVVGGAGQEFGLIACCPVKADAELIASLHNQAAPTADVAECFTAPGGTP